MPEPPAGQPSADSIRTSLHEVARLLRGARHLPAEAQTELSALLEELSRTVDPNTLPSEETDHLARSAAHLVQSLHRRHDAGLLASAKERLEEAALRAETRAPLAADIVRRILETLANLGI